MEKREQRQSLRLTLPAAELITSQGVIKVNNISLQGINLQGNYPLNSLIKGSLTLSGQMVGEVKILIVNHQKESCGGIIVNAKDLAPILNTWFNPKSLITNLAPSDITDNCLSYEDYNHRCRFNFKFNPQKKIEVVEVLIYNNLILWSAQGWQTGIDSVLDQKPDQQKITLVQTLIKESPVFPQSFKDWLLELN